MVTLQVISFQSCGKTALCAGMGKKFTSSNKKVGYIKPIHIVNVGDSAGCQDAVFLREVLELKESSEEICPLHISQEDLWKNLTDGEEDFSTRVKSACDRISEGKNVLLVEGPGDVCNDKVSALACYTIAEKLSAKVILVLGYSADIRSAEVTQCVQKLGQALLGIVINGVPELSLTRVQNESAEYFKTQGINLLSVLPESRILLGVSVAEIASALQGKIISSQDKIDDLIENVMLGAMTPDSGRDYFNRKKNKAIITRSERADMQLAALETSTRCLIVSRQKPSTSVLVKAEDKHVPIIVADKEINEIVAGIEQAMAKARFNNAQKLKACVALLDSRIDFKSFNATLGF